MNEHDSLAFNRRDFLKGGSAATVMANSSVVPMHCPVRKPPPARTTLKLLP